MRTLTIYNVVGDLLKIIFRYAGKYADVCRFVCKKWRSLITPVGAMCQDFILDDMCVATPGLSVVKWARENGCPWGPQMYARAIESDDADIVEYVLDSNCPWQSRTNEVGSERWCTVH